MAAYLLVNAVMYAVFALWCTFRPHTTARFLGYVLPGPPALSEYTAVYGGLEAGLAAFFALALVRDDLRTAAVIAAVCLYAGLFCFRTIVVARHGRAVGKTLGAYVAELALLVWGLPCSLGVHDVAGACTMPVAPASNGVAARRRGSAMHVFGPSAVSTRERMPLAAVIERTVHRAAVTVALATGLATPGIAAAEPRIAPVPGDTLRVESVLGLPRVGAGRRAAVPRDPIEAALASGAWSPPREGDRVLDVDGAAHLWRRVAADSTGWIVDDSLAWGYAFARVEAPRHGVYLLDAKGHRDVIVGGARRAGDVYHRGFLRVPTVLREGPNELLFKEGWGALRAVLYPPPAVAFIDERDPTLPSIVAGEAADTLLAGIVVVNASDEWRDDLQLVAEVDAGTGAARRLSSEVGPVPPLGVRKVAVTLPLPDRVRSGEILARAMAGDSLALPDSLGFHLELRDDGERPLHRITLALDVVLPTEKHYRSFLSGIDGSVQHFGVTPPPALADSARGLVLTLHGAGVPAAQAHHYAPREWAYIVAPTNRREYGFDWEDWGRLDALEVMAEAERLLEIHPRRRWLTGHSMGGHGTWILGAQLPDRFGAIGPSAAWRDFWSYTGADVPDTTGAVGEILYRSANASRLRLVDRNLAHGGVYVLHGENDETVPVTEARAMRERLARFHSNFAYHERPGVGHWWGPRSACMDWAPLMAFLARNPLPAPVEVHEVDFTTVNPAISSQCFWLHVETQERAMAPSRLRAVASPESLLVRVETANVRTLALAPDVFADSIRTGGGDRLRVEIDGVLAEIPSGARRLWARGEAAVRVTRAPDRWRYVEPDARAKGPHRAGPLKDAYRNRMVFVAGTAGTAAENAWSLEAARYAAETFYYRGNGGVEVLLDGDFDPSLDTERNVVLFGNADTHAHWAALLGDCPIDVRRDRVIVGDRRVDGSDLACLFVFPRAGSDVATVAVVAGTTLAGSRATMSLPVFTSGVGYPDWLVIGHDALERGPDGVRAAGFFDASWRLGADTAFRAAEPTR